MTKLNGNLALPSVPGLNGDPSAVLVDRAVAELRRGRAVAVVNGSEQLVVTALETLQLTQLSRLLAVAPQATLFLTAERAAAAGIESKSAGIVAFKVGMDSELETLKAHAGMAERASSAGDVLTPSQWAGSVALVAAGFRLAKAGRLIPALVGFSSTGLSDSSVIPVPMGDVERHAGHIRSGLTLTSQSNVPLADAENSRLALYREANGDGEHVAIVIGDPDPNEILPVRLHSACLTGDLFGSLRCDCGEQLRTAVKRIAELGGGVLLYLDQEGRGIGLANKLRAYAIQDQGLDTLDADRHLGFSADERRYDVAAALLQQLGIKRVRLLTNNPRKIEALQEHGIDVVGRLPLISAPNSHNERYLRAKRERAGHLSEESGS